MHRTCDEKEPRAATARWENEGGSPRPAPRANERRTEKKLIVFDLEPALALGKASVDAEMVALLDALLHVVRVAVISGAGWPQLQTQLLSQLCHDDRLRALSLLPVHGTQFFQYAAGWSRLRGEDVSDVEGRDKSRARLETLLPGYSIRVSGTTSLGVPSLGNDKGYGLRRLRDHLGIALEEMLFVGDPSFPTGDDRPTKNAGVVSIQVRDPGESKRVVETLLACASGVRRQMRCMP